MSEFLIYRSPDGIVTLEVPIANETIWLSVSQIASLFQTDETSILQHLAELFQAHELDATTVTKSPDSPTKPKGMEPSYNLEAILALGYRISSPAARNFRKWATGALSDQLVKGYSLQSSQLLKKGLSSIDESVSILRNTLQSHPCEGDLSLRSLELILRYAKTWNLLLAYDEDHLSMPGGTGKPTFILTYKDACASINFLKSDLLSRHESSQLFGQERDRGLESILYNIEQTFQGKSLYPTIEEKAAHLLYFVIKDHPFIDGNKRIGCFLFLLYLNLQNSPARLNENGLLALALLIAQSDPSQKETMIHLVVNILAD